MKTISVIIPAYNRALLVGETLRSLLNQTVPANEIIVVDDGSQDGTSDTVLEMLKFGEVEKLKISKGRPWPEFKVICQTNAGPAAARNRGLAEATGEFIHFFDSDDIAAPNKHEVQLLALLETGADIAYGPWVKGRFAPKEAQTVASGELSVASLNYENTSYQSPATIYSGFTPEGPVLQARGLPKGNLVQALLTNWSVVPHACLFRKSIVEKAGAFPEDLFGTEDQLMFLRCLLAGAKVVHTPGTFELYRVGDSGKITATGHAQKRHAREWAMFLLKANEEVSSAERRGKSAGRGVPAEARREEEKAEMLKAEKLKKEGTTKDANQHETGKIIDGKIIRTTEEEDGARLASQAGAAFSNPFKSELARDSENTALTRFANAPASPPVTSHSLLATVPEAPSPATAPMALTPATSYSLPVTHRPSAWFGFRLRAYEAWRDLEKFFPHGESELKNELQGIWKKNRFSGLGFQVVGFVIRKFGGVKLRVLGYREHGSFKCAKFSASSEN